LRVIIDEGYRVRLTEEPEPTLRGPTHDSVCIDECNVLDFDIIEFFRRRLHDDIYEATFGRADREFVQALLEEVHHV
jgi:hypothetical protein